MNKQTFFFDFTKLILYLKRMSKISSGGYSTIDADFRLASLFLMAYQLFFLGYLMPNPLS